MCEFAKVKFLTDGVTSTVPTKDFKVVLNSFVEPKDLELGSTYQVFWSPVPDEDPSKLLSAGNEILEVDDSPELEKKRRKANGPLKGYYKAVLVSLLETDDFLKPYKRELSESNCLPPTTKRSKVPSSKALENQIQSQQATSSKGGQATKRHTKGDSSEKVEKSTILEARQRNLNSLLEKAADLKHHKSKSKKSSRRVKDKEEHSPRKKWHRIYGGHHTPQKHLSKNDGTHQESEGSSQGTKRIDHSPHTPNVRSRDGNFISTPLIQRVQQVSRTPPKVAIGRTTFRTSPGFEIKDDDSRRSNSKDIIRRPSTFQRSPGRSLSLGAGIHQTNNLQQENLDSRAIESESAEYWKNKFLAEREKMLKLSQSKPHEDEGTDHADDQFYQDQDQHDSPFKDDDGYQHFSNEVDKMVDSVNASHRMRPASTNVTTDSELDSTLKLSDSSSSSEGENEVVVYERKKRMPLPGLAGDSAALATFAAKLWKPHEFVVRSPTGLPPSNRRGTVPYPRMTPKKVDQCREFIKKRALKENPNISETELTLRTNRTEYILGQRVSTWRKSFRKKNLTFSTAEELLEERKKMKREKRLRKKGPSKE